MKVENRGGSVFRGSSFHTMDAKGRVIVPTRFRDVMRNGGDDTLMVSKMDRCLVAYPLTEWHQIEARILALAEKSDRMRRFRRVFIGGAHECTCDRQERILIPPTLRQYADLTKEIVLVGVLNHIEIWSRERWDLENTALEEDFQAGGVGPEIAGLGL